MLLTEDKHAVEHWFTFCLGLSSTHIVNFCPLIKFDGGLLRLHEADEADVD